MSRERDYVTSFGALTLDHHFLHRTALLMWFVLACGVAGSLGAAWRDGRRRTRIAAALTVLWVPLLVTAYLVVTRLPAPQPETAGDRVPNFALADHLGKSTSLHDLLRDGSILLVFYRGHW